MATADVTVLPIGREGASAGDVIAQIQRLLEDQDKVKFRMHAMGTSLEGDVADILALAGQIHAVPFEAGIPRAYTVLKIDERRDREQTLDEKIESVRRHLREAGGTRRRDYTPGD